MPRDLPTFPALSPADLMGDPAHMLEWLRSKRPDEIVAFDMWHPCECLGATFLIEMGHPTARWGLAAGIVGEPRLVTEASSIDGGDAIVDAIADLMTTNALGQVTAALALAALERAIEGQPAP